MAGGSWGAARTAPPGGSRLADPHALFRAADEARYAATHGGRNRVEALDGGDRRIPDAAALPSG